MTVADILYFGALAHVALVSAFVLLRQYRHGDLTEHRATTRRYRARPARRPAPRPAPRTVAAHTHRPQAA
jgi:hypothetical protein